MNAFTAKLKSVDEKARELNWSPKRVRALIREGLPVVKIGRQHLINDDSFDQYLHKRQMSVMKQMPDMTKIEYNMQIRLLKAENKRLKERITELETAIKKFSEASGLFYPR